MVTGSALRAFPVGGEVAGPGGGRRHCGVPSLRRASHDAFDPAGLVRSKGDRTVAVCIPARDEAATVGEVVRTVHEELVRRVPLVDELVVVDDRSTDGTAEVAAAAGARVVDAATTLPDVPGPGKGAALWKSLHETTSDIVVWVDGDIEGFGTRFVTGLVGALLTHPEASFAKGTYRRPLVEGGGGGRVTELVARPLLSTLFPDLAALGQPLSGEYGGHRRLLERLPFVTGYGVDLALLVDVADAVGVEGIVEVDLGERVHRNRPLDQLGPQATEVLRAALVRSGADDGDHAVALRRPGREALLVAHRELPPVAGLRSYARRSA